MIRTIHLPSGVVRYKARVGSGPQVTFDRLADAERYETEQKRSRQRGRAGLDQIKEPIKFADLVKLWEDNFNPSQWRQDMIAYSVQKWANAYVHQIEPERLGAWLIALTGKRGQPLSGKTKAHILETLRQVLNAGVEWGYLRKSPARRGAFKAPSKRSRVSPIRPFESWAEVEKVADAMPTLRANAFVRFLCATGIRPGEALSLQWSDINIPSKSMRVGSKTDAGHRTVPLSWEARFALMDLPRSLSGLVFTAKRGGRFDYQAFRREDWPFALATCELEKRTPYEMRHTFATLALAQGASIDDVATVMGHKDISVAFTYYRKWIRAMADRLRITLDQIGAEDAQDQGRLSR